MGSDLPLESAANRFKQVLTEKGFILFVIVAYFPIASVLHISLP